MAGDAVTFAEYIAIDAENWSSVKWMRDSARSYRWHRDNDQPSTTSQLRGRLLHHLVFEFEQVGTHYAIFEGDRRGTNEYKAFEAAHPDKPILKASEMDEVRAQAAAVRASPLVAPYLDDGEFELTLQWTDQATRLPCKGRVDWWHPATRTLLDLKGGTINEQRFARVAANLGFVHQVGGHYAAGIKATTSQPPAKVGFVVVEPKPPYDVALFVLSEKQIEAAHEEVTELLRQVASCRLRGQWPGRYAAEEPLWEFSGEPKISFAEED